MNHYWELDHERGTTVGISSISNAKAPLFEEFIYQFCSFREDRVQFIRSWFWATMNSWLEGQVFLYIQGPGSTGKSQLASILTALMGM